MTDAVVVDTRLFTPVRVTEDKLESLLRTAAPKVFPGFDFFDFKPAIRCGDSTRHPDGALLAPGAEQWWVVEVETHLHDPQEHIEPQLRDLAGGFYGPDAFAYLERHATFDASRYPVDEYEPSLLLVIDSLTPEIRSVATRLSVQAVECAVFRSVQANQYALVVAGQRPHVDSVAQAPGIELLLAERDGMAFFAPADGKKMPQLKGYDVVIADTARECFATSDGAGIVAPLTVAEIQSEAGSTFRFKLISSTSVLLPLLESSEVVPVGT